MRTEKDLKCPKNPNQTTSKQSKNSKSNKESEPSKSENCSLDLYIDLQQSNKNLSSSINQKKAKAKNSRWTKPEESKLIELREELGNDWDQIASFFPKKTREQCCSKYSKAIMKFKKGKWTSEEDEHLLQLIQKNGFDWKLISCDFPQRSLTQIKQRFFNCLDPKINKNKLSEKEDRILVRQYRIHGPDWKRIALFFENRPTNLIKNRFYALKRNIKKCKLEENFFSFNLFLHLISFFAFFYLIAFLF